MEDILNASLAGGVIIGANANLITTPFAAILVGFFAGGLSTFGFEYLSAKLQEWVGLFDTAGIHNLHGMPGAVGGLLSILFVSLLTTQEIKVLIDDFTRTPEEQGGYQGIALAFTLGTAIVSGLATGLLIKSSFFMPPTDLFNDKPYWHSDDNELNTTISN
jgi:ammonium transporter Rh